MMQGGAVIRSTLVTGERSRSKAALVQGFPIMAAIKSLQTGGTRSAKGTKLEGSAMSTGTAHFSPGR